MVESPRSPGVDLGAPAEPQVVRILVKSPWQKEEFLLHTDTSVREFKAHVARQFSRWPAAASASASADHVALVYAGRLLKDGRTLRQHGLHLDREATVHAVLRGPPPPRGPPARHDDRLGELTASLGLKTATFAEFQSQLLSNPEAMLQLLESPSIQRKLSCPGLVRELVSESPPVRQALQQSAPEIGRFLGSPEGLSLVVQLARNPAAVREILAAAPAARPPPGCRPGNAPSSGDHPGARPDALAGLLGLAEKAVRNHRTGSPLGPEPSSGPQAPLDGGEHRLPSAKGCPPKPGPQNAAAGGREHSQEESQGASAAVRSLLHQIMKHLLQSMAGGGPRRPSGPAPCVPPTSRRRAPGHGSPREEEGQQQQQTTTTTTTDSTEALLAHGTPSELRGLLEIQRRLRALVAEDAPAERRGRPERPARRAHSITSLCDLVLPAGGGGGSSLHLSAQQLLPARLGSGLVVAGDQGASRPRGSSAQPSAEQKRLYKL
ncbi:hypothetical protein JRQ81_019600 [Phrynocephalus forsythii]|uniref:Ubiquitin-like domain-containing protein n=1 Tax=Phrynocephalus forsythii TaxID=171643 RepID=A0A9Q0XQI0_9SAUR|nr:hypothetical protein JRQ81_019600 [Phrynocephalus forsythii]